MKTANKRWYESNGLMGKELEVILSKYIAVCIRDYILTSKSTNSSCVVSDESPPLPTYECFHTCSHSVSGRFNTCICFSLPGIPVLMKIRFSDLIGQVPKGVWHKSYVEKKWVHLKLYFYLIFVDQAQDVCGKSRKFTTGL